MERPAPLDLLDLARAILGRPRAPVFASSRAVFPRGPPWLTGLTRGQLLAKFGLDGPSLELFVQLSQERHEEECQQLREEDDGGFAPSS